jgi:hypothetical protein
MHRMCHIHSVSVTFLCCTIICISFLLSRVSSVRQRLYEQFSWSCKSPYYVVLWFIDTWLQMSSAMLRHSAEQFSSDSSKPVATFAFTAHRYERCKHLCKCYTNICVTVYMASLTCFCNIFKLVIYMYICVWCYIFLRSDLSWKLTF